MKLIYNKTFKYNFNRNLKILISFNDFIDPMYNFKFFKVNSMIVKNVCSGNMCFININNNQMPSIIFQTEVVFLCLP